MDRKSIRNLFQKLGIDPVRILDISFPARSVISILIHAAYHTEFLAALTGAKLGEYRRSFLLGELDLSKTLTLLIQSILLTLSSLIWLPMTVPVLLPLYTKTDVLEYYTFFVPT
jgi:hypothetical protein